MYINYRWGYKLDCCRDVVQKYTICDWNVCAICIIISIVFLSYIIYNLLQNHFLLMLSHNRGIIVKGYKKIRQKIVNLVVDTLFDPIGIKQYFSSRKKGMRPMLHFGLLKNNLLQICCHLHACNNFICRDPLC